MPTKTEELQQNKQHPCFDQDARHEHARIHLPVAPRCNVQCGFCNRRYACANENRPGITSSLQTPMQAVQAVENALHAGVPLSVVGVAGPGDAFANVEETLETLRRIHDRFPELLLCLSTNGLELLPWVNALEHVGVHHLTITVNAIDPLIASRIYQWIRVDGKTIKGLEAGQEMVRRQTAAIQSAAGRFILKINTVVIPDVNMHHVASIAKAAQAAGADLHNCIPMIPVANTPLAQFGEPLPEEMLRVRALAGSHLPQMTHCNRCRADACGLLDK